MRLDENWTLEDDTGTYILSVSLPFDNLSALHYADLIEDPYFGRNEFDLRWICGREWRLSREVTLEDPDVVLALAGLDGVVDVTLNGETVLTADNSFRTWRVDLSESARVGTNDLVLTYRPIVAEATKRQAEQPFRIPYHEGNCPLPNGNMLRKPQCDFGWDWNIALAPIGVTGGIWIEPAAALRFDCVHVDQEHHDTEAGSVTLTVSATVENGEGETVSMRFIDRERDAVVENGVAIAKFFVEVPQLWWPSGQGDQPLFDLDLRCGQAQETRRIGLRKVELLTPDDDHGARFAFRINGREVFMKGANWIPADALSGRISRDMVRALLQSAKDANMNMIRVWGGGRYEPDWFYHMCDEMGLVVWQDFMFACNLYPADEAFLDNVEAEVRENVRRLHHHACLALWCGDNELLGALTWFEESVENRDRYLVLYDRLNRTLERALKDEDPHAIWWPSSPSQGRFNYGDAWHEDGAGDMHFWSVWHENKPFDAYRSIRPRFVSEFGFQSYPSNRIIDSFVAPQDRNIAAPVLEAHQKNEGGNERIAATMFRNFRFPEGFSNFVYLSQVQQGLAIKTAVSAWRALKPHCMGTIYWQLNDTWPCASWSSLDYGGNWKLLHHMAEKFYAPVCVTVTPNGGSFIFNVVNDLADVVDVSVQVAALKLDGSTRPVAEVELGAWPSKALDVLELGHDALHDDEIFAFTWQYDDVSAGDIFAPKPWKAYDLHNPHVSMNVQRDGSRYDIDLSVEAVALFVALEADVPGRFSTNAVTILPGGPVRISFTPDDPHAEPKFVQRDLYKATYRAQG